jgi:hypothetical protein
MTGETGKSSIHDVTKAIGLLRQLRGVRAAHERDDARSKLFRHSDDARELLKQLSESEEESPAVRKALSGLHKTLVGDGRPIARKMAEGALVQLYTMLGRPLPKFEGPASSRTEH